MKTTPYIEFLIEESRWIDEFGKKVILPMLQEAQKKIDEEWGMTKRDILEECMAGGMGCCDCHGNQAAFRECGMEISRLRFEVARLRLTDEEREAVKRAVSAASNVDHPAEDALRKLLERLA